MKKMFLKKAMAYLMAAAFAVSAAGCAGGDAAGQSSAAASEAAAGSSGQDGQTPAGSQAAQGAVSFTDALGRQVTVESHDRVASLYGSFAEAWVLAGGTLVASTTDAVQERKLDLGTDAIDLGGNMEPSLEEILAAEPDFVILTADISAQVELDRALEEAGIAHAYFRTDCFEEYRAMMEIFCEMTGRQDLYEQNAAQVGEQITRILELVEGQPAPSVLFVRAYSTGAKAKGADNQTGMMLEDLGADNIAARHESLLEELSMEEIIAEDPQFILVTVMGSSEQKGLDYMRATVESNPAWPGLQAVQNGRYLLLPKELFHYKPNARWGESYAYLAKILYPELEAQIDAA